MPLEFLLRGLAQTALDVDSAEAQVFDSLFSGGPVCGILSAMGKKDKGRKETKKAPKPKPKPEPSRREIFTPAPPK